MRAWGSVSVILLTVFLVVRVLGFLRQTTAGDLSAHSALTLLLLKAITYLDLLAPLSLYIAALLVTARMLQDHELTAACACGIGIAQFLKPALRLAAMVGVLTALFSLYLSPLAAQTARVLTQELRQRADLIDALPGVFTATPNRSGVYFIDRRDGDDAFDGIFVYDGSGAVDRIVVAKNGRWVAFGQRIDAAKRGADGRDDVGGVELGDVRGDVRGDGFDGDNLASERLSDALSRAEIGADDFLILENGARYHAVAGAADYQSLEFENYGMRIKKRPLAGRRLPLDALSMPHLTRRVFSAAASPDAIGEFHWRLSKVAMLPVLMIFALAFSGLANRKNRFPGMLPALLIYLVYSNFLGFGMALIQRGAAPPHWTLWGVHLIFLCLAAYLLRRRNRGRRLVPGLA